MDPLGQQLMRELAIIEGRPEVEECLTRVMVERRAALSNVDRIERELGRRLLEIEAYERRRARMPRRLFAVLDALGFFPFCDPDAPRLQRARSELAAREQAVASVLDELRAFRDSDGRIDALVAVWNSERSSKLSIVPPLETLGVRLERLRIRLDTLERTYESLAIAGWAASSASLLLTKSAKIARSELHAESLPLRRKEGRSLREADHLLGVAASELGCASMVTDDASNAASLARAAWCSSAELACSPPLVDSRGTRVVPIERANELCGTVGAEAKSSAESVGRELTRASAEIKSLTAHRDERIRQLLRAL